MQNKELAIFHLNTFSDAYSATRTRKENNSLTGREEGYFSSYFIPFPYEVFTRANKFHGDYSSFSAPFNPTPQSGKQYHRLKST